jgi:hypothetical protein
MLTWHGRRRGRDPLHWPEDHVNEIKEYEQTARCDGAYLDSGRTRRPLAAADAALPQTVTRAQFEAWFKDISNWGRWGKGDELGMLNLITPEKRKGCRRTGARRRVSLAGTGTE